MQSHLLYLNLSKKEYDIIPPEEEWWLYNSGKRVRGLVEREWWWWYHKVNYQDWIRVLTELFKCQQQFYWHNKIGACVQNVLSAQNTPEDWILNTGKLKHKDWGNSHREQQKTFLPCCGDSCPRHDRKSDRGNREPLGHGRGCGH